MQMWLWGRPAAHNCMLSQVGNLSHVDVLCALTDFVRLIQTSHGRPCQPRHYNCAPPVKPQKKPRHGVHGGIHPRHRHWYVQLVIVPCHQRWLQYSGTTGAGARTVAKPRGVDLVHASLHTHAQHGCNSTRSVIQSLRLAPALAYTPTFLATEPR
jgi:hypothetical protein